MVDSFDYLLDILDRSKKNPDEDPIEDNVKAYHNENFPIPEKYLVTKRRAIESLYCGLLKVVVKEEVTNEYHITTFKDVTLLEDIPCRLSEQTVNPTTSGEPSKKERDIKVFLAPEIEIPAGSTIIITQHGKTGFYKQSGEPYLKSDSQTIPLVYKDYA